MHCSLVPQHPPCTYTGHTILPNTPHPTHAEVVLDIPWLKHRPTMQRHLLDWTHSSPCAPGSDPDPAELSLLAGGSASVRNQSLAAPQCQTPLPSGIPWQAGCLTIPPQCSWEASRLCLAQGPFLSPGKQICWERGQLHPGMRNKEQDSPGDFILVSPKQITCPLRRHFKSTSLRGNTQLKIQTTTLKNKTKSSGLKKKQPKTTNRDRGLGMQLEG